MKALIHILTCSLLWAAVVSGLHAAPADFRLTEYLGHTWQREPVTFPLTAAQLRQAKTGRALNGPDGQPIPYQLIGNDTPITRIAFQADMPPYATQAFSFTTTPAIMTTDLRIAETADTIELTNARTGIRVAKALAAGQGPIAGIRLSSGAWVTGSRLATDQPIANYAAIVVARGPVFAEIACRATIGKDAVWEQRYRIYAGEPVVLVDEFAKVDGPTATFSLDLKKDFNPDTMHYRYGKAVPGASYGKSATWKLQTGRR